jgi:hypothetical protein
MDRFSPPSDFSPTLAAIFRLLYKAIRKKLSSNHDTEERCTTTALIGVLYTHADFIKFLTIGSQKKI